MKNDIQEDTPLIDKFQMIRDTVYKDYQAGYKTTVVPLSELLNLLDTVIKIEYMRMQYEIFITSLRGKE